MAKNVLGTELQSCSQDPLTGFYRDGCCNTGGDDAGVHVVCARVTDDFLAFSKAAGNDLSTPMPAYGFAGLSDGDQWCLCASRWKEALEADKAPPVVLAATHMATLEYVTLDDLRRHAVDNPETDGETNDGEMNDRETNDGETNDREMNDGETDAVDTGTADSDTADDESGPGE